MANPFNIDNLPDILCDPGLFANATVYKSSDDIDAFPVVEGADFILETQGRTAPQVCALIMLGIPVDYCPEGVPEVLQNINTGHVIDFLAKASPALCANTPDSVINGIVEAANNERNN